METLIENPCPNCYKEAQPLSHAVIEDDTSTQDTGDVFSFDAQQMTLPILEDALIFFSLITTQMTPFS